jgi:hypothetical protein
LIEFAHGASLERIVNGFVNTADNKALNTWCYDYIKKHPFIEHGQVAVPATGKFKYRHDDGV